MVGEDLKFAMKEYENGKTTTTEYSQRSTKGQPWAGGFFGAAGLGSLVGAFIHGTRDQNNHDKN
jgi:hypothetical protein